MDIKPRFNENTITFSAPVKKTSLESKVIKDPDGVISNGLYKVIRWEQLRQKIVLSITSSLSLGLITLITLYATVYNVSWLAYVLPAIVLLYAMYKTITTFAEGSWLKKSVNKYKEDKKMGLTTSPPFLAKLYVDLQKKQITHNWLTFFVLFNGGIITLLLWWLKDVSWWIFHFDQWINDLFANPTLMSWIFTIVLVVVGVFHIAMAIQRKKRLLDMDAYFGGNIVPQSELEIIKQSRNKAYRRMFVIYLMIIVIIPALVWVILRVLKRKR